MVYNMNKFKPGDKVKIVSTKEAIKLRDKGYFDLIKLKNLQFPTNNHEIYGVHIEDYDYYARFEFIIKEYSPDYDDIWIKSTNDKEILWLPEFMLKPMKSKLYIPDKLFEL